MTLRITWYPLFTHVHCTVFTGPTLATAHATSGELCVRVEDWPALRAKLATIATLEQVPPR